MDVFTIPTLRHTSVEELGTGALPPIHPRLADMLDGVLGARMRVARDVERSNPGCAMLRGTEGHDRTPNRTTQLGRVSAKEISFTSTDFPSISCAALTAASIPA